MVIDENVFSSEATPAGVSRLCRAEVVFVAQLDVEVELVELLLVDVLEDEDVDMEELLVVEVELLLVDVDDVELLLELEVELVVEVVDDGEVELELVVDALDVVDGDVDEVVVEDEVGVVDVVEEVDELEELVVVEGGALRIA
jgi:hypothetical protein